MLQGPACSIAINFRMSLFLHSMRLMVIFFRPTYHCYAETIASTLLQVENGLPRLLCLLAQSEEAEHLAQQLHGALDVAVLPSNASLDEIRDIIAMVNASILLR